MSQFNFKGNITGNNNHFGDIYSLNSKDFTKNSERKFNKTELDLLDIIFKETSSEEERIQIIESLREIDNKCVKNDNKSFWVKIISFLPTIGKDILVGIITESLTPLLLKP